MLADAKQVKHLPGRPKRDPADSRWLAACSGRGAIRPCFVATPEFRVIRLHTRYRRDLTEERTREKQRALGAVTGETAVAAGRTQTREGARYRRLARRRGKAKAQVAVGNTQLMSTTSCCPAPARAMRISGPDYHDRQASTRRQLAHHAGKPAALGFEVTLCRIPDPEPGSAGPGNTQAA